jgi:hypothetical protein
MHAIWEKKQKGNESKKILRVRKKIFTRASKTEQILLLQQNICR